MVLELIAIVVLGAFALSPPAQDPVLIEVAAADLDRCRMALAQVLIPAAMADTDLAPVPTVHCVVSE